MVESVALQSGRSNFFFPEEIVKVKQGPGRQWTQGS
jgi:hypothetical protein